MGRILGYWRAERRTILQGFVALVVATLGGLVGGLVLGRITGTLERLPGLIILIPAAIATRGNIFGALASRLGTSIHAGLFATTRERQGPLYQNVYAAAVLTLAVSLLVAVVAKTVSVLFGIPSMSVLDFIVISVLGGVLASVFVGIFAVALSLWAFRGGWDLDSVAAPLITASGDMFTVPALFLASFAVDIRWVTPALAGAFIGVAIVAAVRGVATDLPSARGIIRESLPVLFVAGTVDVFAGVFVQARLDEFVQLPALLILIPPVLGNAGGLGGLLASRLTSKLHLGVLPPRGRPEPLAFLDSSIVFLIGVAVFPLLGAAAQLLAAATGLASPGLARMVGVATLAGLMATLLAVVVAYYAAAASYRLGLDPDNHSLPLITSSMDFLGVVALVIALVAFGVG
ncbi:MAG TPA: magnesium transporter [Actinomycetota bacterium]|nr:magnesium transporter [Actinomycetota bacterium]